MNVGIREAHMCKRTAEPRTSADFSSISGSPFFLVALFFLSDGFKALRAEPYPRRKFTALAKAAGYASVRVSPARRRFSGSESPERPRRCRPPFRPRCWCWRRSRCRSKHPYEVAHGGPCSGDRLDCCASLPPVVAHMIAGLPNRSSLYTNIYFCQHAKILEGTGLQRDNGFRVAALCFTILSEPAGENLFSSGRATTFKRCHARDNVYTYSHGYHIPRASVFQNPAGRHCYRL